MRAHDRFWYFSRSISSPALSSLAEHLINSAPAGRGYLHLPQFGGNFNILSQETQPSTKVTGHYQTSTAGQRWKMYMIIKLLLAIGKSKKEFSQISSYKSGGNTVQKIPSQISLVYSGISTFRNCNWETKNFVQFEKLGATGERN